MRESTPVQRRPHPHKALSTRAVLSAKATGRTRRVADGGGLYLLVAPGGSKSWLLRTIVKGKRCDIGLGGTSLVSLAEAREEAARLRKIARSGGDPLTERRRARTVVPTFEEAARRVHDSHAVAFRNDKHRKQWLSSLGYVFSVLGAKRVDAIITADVLAALSSRWLERPETSRRVLQRMRVVFDWSEAQGFRSGANPTQNLTKVLPKHRRTAAHHPALPYPELSAFIEALRESDSSEIVKLAFEFTILCATRTSETLKATWAEVNLGTRTWTIPAFRMKPGVDHRVPLSLRCIEILERTEALSSGAKYVFPGRTVEKPLSNMAFLMTLRRMKRTDITVHGFRSTFRDWAAERTNFPRAVCEAALAHTLRDKTEAAYHRTDLFQRRRELMASWSAFATAEPADTIAIGAR